MKKVAAGKMFEWVSAAEVPAAGTWADLPGGFLTVSGASANGYGRAVKEAADGLYYLRVWTMAGTGSADTVEYYREIPGSSEDADAFMRDLAERTARDLARRLYDGNKSGKFEHVAYETAFEAALSALKADRSGHEAGKKALGIV